MKRLPLFALLSLTLTAAACTNDGGLTAAPDEPEASPTPVTTLPPDPEATPTPPLPPEADVAITLAWDDIGDDWELHLIKPDGRINDPLTDCTWTTCIYTSPDWGVAGDASDDPHKDIDDTDTYGPERIWQAEPESGTFTVLVEHWGPGSSDSDGVVSILVNGDLYEFAKNDLPSMHVWSVATIELPSGTVTPGTDTYDCSANWSGGCLDPLP